MIVSNLPYVAKTNKVVVTAHEAQAYFDKYPVIADDDILIVDTYDNLEIIGARLGYGMLDFKYRMAIDMDDEENKEYIFLGTGLEVNAKFPKNLNDAEDDKLYVIKVKVA